MDLTKLTPDEIIDGHLLGSVKGDISPLVYSTKVSDNAGFFGAMELILTLMDFLGRMYTGAEQCSGRNAVRYIRNYMGKVDSDYKKVGGLVYVVWRHGTVHQRLPIKIRMNKRTVTTFGIDNDQAATKGIVAARGHVKVYLAKFYEDFVQSVKLFLADIKSSPDKQRKMRKAWLSMIKATDWTTVKRRNNYLKSSDYKFVCKRKP